MKYISIFYARRTALALVNEFKKQNIIISFRTNNNIWNLLRTKSPQPTTEKTGIYKINCSDCDKFYIGQTGRGFLQRFREHLPKNNIYMNRSQFANHLISKGHNYKNFESNFKAIHILSLIHI